MIIKDRLAALCLFVFVLHIGWRDSADIIKKIISIYKEESPKIDALSDLRQ